MYDVGRSRRKALIDSPAFVCSPAELPVACDSPLGYGSRSKWLGVRPLSRVDSQGVVVENPSVPTSGPTLTEVR